MLDKVACMLNVSCALYTAAPVHGICADGLSWNAAHANRSSIQGQRGRDSVRALGMEEAVQLREQAERQPRTHTRTHAHTGGPPRARRC